MIENDTVPYFGRLSNRGRETLKKTITVPELAEGEGNRYLQRLVGKEIKK